MSTEKDIFYSWNGVLNYKWLWLLFLYSMQCFDISASFIISFTLCPFVFNYMCVHSSITLPQHSSSEFLIHQLNRNDINRHPHYQRLYLIQSIHSFNTLTVCIYLQQLFVSKNFSCWYKTNVLIISNLIQTKTTVSNKMTALHFITANIFVANTN